MLAHAPPFPGGGLALGVQVLTSRVHPRREGGIGVSPHCGWGGGLGPSHLAPLAGLSVPASLSTGPTEPSLRTARRPSPFPARGGSRPSLDGAPTLRPQGGAWLGAAPEVPQATAERPSSSLRHLLQGLGCAQNWKGNDRHRVGTPVGGGCENRSLILVILANSWAGAGLLC